MAEGQEFTIPEPQEIKRRLPPKNRSRELKKRVGVDVLTGLKNRGWFQQELERSFADSTTRSGEPLTLLMFDLDFFKLANDQYGHSAGDLILRGVGRKKTRPLEELVRYGGDEFIQLIRGPVTDEQLLAIADRYKQGIETESEEILTSLPVTTPPKEGLPVTRVSASFGIARLEGEASLTDFFKKVDKALYRAKEEKGQTFIARGNNGSIAVERLQIAA